MAVYVVYQDQDLTSMTCEAVFDSQQDFKRYAERDRVTIKKAIPLKATGKTYQNKRQSIRDVIMDICEAQFDVDGLGLSYGEESTLWSWCKCMAKRYGLIKEFEANGII